MEEKKVNRNEDIGGEIERERLEGVWKTKLRNVLDLLDARGAFILSYTLSATYAS